MSVEFIMVGLVNNSNKKEPKSFSIKCLKQLLVELYFETSRGFYLKINEFHQWEWENSKMPKVLRFNELGGLTIFVTELQEILL